MRGLVGSGIDRPRDADAIAVFCYRARNFLGALAAAPGGVDTPSFPGGIGEHAAPSRAQISDGMACLEIHIHGARHSVCATVASAEACSVTVRVVRATRNS